MTGGIKRIRCQLFSRGNKGDRGWDHQRYLDLRMIYVENNVFLVALNTL